MHGRGLEKRTAGEGREDAMREERILSIPIVSGHWCGRIADGEECDTESLTSDE